MEDSELIKRKQAFRDRIQQEVDSCDSITRQIDSDSKLTATEKLTSKFTQSSDKMKYKCILQIFDYHMGEQVLEPTT